MQHRDLFSGFIRLHVLHHAAKDEIYGAWMLEELAEHGYKLSPGTLYPMLHRMKERGYLTQQNREENGRIRKYYRCTDLGIEALTEARQKIAELTGEIAR